MDQQNLEKSILLELERENQLRLKEELRSKLANLVASQRNEINRSAYAMTQISKYVEVKQEMDRKLDKQYQRKMDHEQKILIEERRLRDNAAFEEAKKRALIEEKHRQEKAKAEAEVIAWCEDSTGTFDSTVFACERVILLVTSKIPDVMDFLVAEFHKVSIYTVPKYLQPSDQALQNDDYWKMTGYHEKDGKMESSESYLNRVQSYMKLYAAIIQTEIEGIRNAHGLGKGWSWLARFLNAFCKQIHGLCFGSFLEDGRLCFGQEIQTSVQKMLDVSKGT